MLKFLQGADDTKADQINPLKAQIIYWHSGATDGHGENFSVFLYPIGKFKLAPYYDVLTLQTNFDNNELQRREMKLALSVGNSNHYRLDKIITRQFYETAEKAVAAIPADFSVNITTSVLKGDTKLIENLAARV